MAEKVDPMKAGNSAPEFSANSSTNSNANFNSNPNAKTNTESSMESKNSGDLTGEFLPRVSTSKKWTTLPADFLEKVRTVFAGQFEMEAQDGTFVVEGRIYPDELILRTGYLESGRLRQINFEASVDLPKKKAPKAVLSEVDAESEIESAVLGTESKTMEKLYIALDALGSVMEDYFDLGNDDDGTTLDIPPHWRAYEFEGQTVYLQFSTVNSSLEDEANRLLGLTLDSLYNEAAPTEDALGNAEIDSELAIEIQKALRARDAGVDLDYLKDLESDVERVHASHYETEHDA